MLYNKIDWLRLFFTPSIGGITFNHLIEKFKTPTLAIENLDEVKKHIKRYKNNEKILVPSANWVENYIEKCHKQNVFLVAAFESEYPKLLLKISDYPPVLHIKCTKEFFNAKLLNRNNFAIVGARNASLQGGSFAAKLACDLSNEGLVIVSGLARGIDAAVHKAALTNAAINSTIAVLGCGINVIYPQENKELYENIANGGAIISEATMNQQPRPQTFTYRNRIISGISCGVLVVEAARKSGSLITAAYAAEQGRDVFAVPGHPYDPRAQGANYLIRNGAILTENYHQIIEQIKNYKQIDLLDHAYNRDEKLELFENENLEANVDDVNLLETLLDQLNSAPLSIDEIARTMDIKIKHLQGVIAQLELSGKVQVDGNMIHRIFV